MTGLLTGLILFSSCKKDDAPVIDPRDAFIGEYDAEDCFGFEETLEIEKDSKDSKIIIINSQHLEDFYEIKNVKAEVSGNEFNFEEEYSYENPMNGETIEGVIKGEGKLNGKKLSITTEYTEEGDSDTCEIEGDKQN